MRSHLITSCVVLGGLAALALAQPKPAPPPPDKNPVTPTRDVPTVVIPMLKSAKTSCAGDDFVGLELCTNTGACTTMTSSCFPYRCNTASKNCSQTCAGDKDCSGGFACSKGKCVVPRNFCDGNVSKNLFGGSRNCAPYLCDGATGQCRAQTCTSIDDCSTGNQCSFKNQCVPQPK